MLPTNPFLFDGDYGEPSLISRTPRERPFENFGDADTERYVAVYDVDHSYVKGPLGTVDPETPGFYLLAEPKLDIFQGTVGRLSRTYINLPAGYTVGASVNYGRPIVPSTGQYRAYGSETLGNAGLFYQLDVAFDRFHGYSRRAVATDQGVSNTPTGGTYPLTFGADTTGSLTYNDSAATVKTALDGLTSVTNYGGLATLTGTYSAADGFLVTFNNFSAATIDVSGLTYTEATPQTGVVTSNGGWTQQVSMQLVLPGLQRVNFGASVDISGLTGYTAGSAQIGDLRGFGFPNYAETMVQIESSTPLSGGTFTLTVFGQTTVPIAYNADTSVVASALNALSNVAAHGGVTVYRGPVSYGYITGGSIITDPLRIIFRALFGLPPFTGGTYDVTLFGQTASGIAHNANLAAIESALNALTEVTERGGVVVSGTGLSSDGTTISFTLTFSAAAISGSGASLTPAPGAVIVGIVSGTNGRQQTIKLTASQVARVLTFTNAHGFTEGEPIYLKHGSDYRLARSDWALVSATQISVNPAVAPWSTSTAITEGGQYRGVYEPGPADHRAKVAAVFYWPGLTPGIATFEDIPEAAPSISDARYLDAFVNGVEYVSYAAGSLGLWEGPVYKRETTSIKVQRGEEAA